MAPSRQWLMNGLPTAHESDLFDHGPIGQIDNDHRVSEFLAEIRAPSVEKPLHELRVHCDGARPCRMDPHQCRFLCDRRRREQVHG